VLSEVLPGVGLAEEARDADQKVLEQLVDLGRMVVEVSEIILKVVEMSEAHPTLDPARNGSLLVRAEIVLGAGAKDRENRLHVLGALVRQQSCPPLAVQVAVPGEPEQRRRQ